MREVTLYSSTVIVNLVCTSVSNCTPSMCVVQYFKWAVLRIATQCVCKTFCLLDRFSYEENDILVFSKHHNSDQKVIRYV